MNEESRLDQNLASINLGLMHFGFDRLMVCLWNTRSLSLTRSRVPKGNTASNRVSPKMHVNPAVYEYSEINTVHPADKAAG